MLGNVTNLPMTPERARQWKESTSDAVLGLRKGTQACIIITGEEAEAEQLKTRHNDINKLKVQLTQRELIIESYRLFGNSRPDISEADENIVGRNNFYTGFLKKKEDLLGEFIRDTSQVSLDTARLLVMLDHDGILKDANASAHDVTYGDVQTMLELLKEQDTGTAQAWEELIMLLTDNPNIMNTDIKHTSMLVKDACRAKRERVCAHQLQQEAEQFQTRQLETQQTNAYKKLEKKGLVVSSTTLMNTVAQLEAHINQCFEGINGHFEGLEQGIEQRFEGMERRFEGIEQHFEGVERCFEGIERHIEQHFEGLERHFEGIDQHLHTSMIMQYACALITVTVGICVLIQHRR